MNKKQIGGLVISVLILFFIAGFFGYINRPQQSEPVFGSVSQASEYHSTSTSHLSTPQAVIKSDVGVLGSVVITGANTGNVYIYDATTTNVNLRTDQKPTSTILIGSLPASLAAGTYTFDVAFYNGLLFDYTGLVPTSTITYR